MTTDKVSGGRFPWLRPLRSLPPALARGRARSLWIVPRHLPRFSIVLGFNKIYLASTSTSLGSCLCSLSGLCRGTSRVSLFKQIRLFPTHPLLKPVTCRAVWIVHWHLPTRRSASVFIRIPSVGKQFCQSSLPNKFVVRAVDLSLLSPTLSLVLWPSARAPRVFRVNEFFVP